MKKLIIVLMTVLLFACGACSTANAEERAGRFAANSGIGFGAGQGVSIFQWSMGGDYYFTDMISANVEMSLLAGSGAFFFQILPRARFTFDTPIDGLEPFADAGFGMFFGDATDWIMAFGGGAYWFFLLDNNLGLGTDLDFTFSGIGGARFNLQWAVISAMYRF